MPPLSIGYVKGNARMMSALALVALCYDDKIDLAQDSVLANMSTKAGASQYLLNIEVFFVNTVRKPRMPALIYFPKFVAS